MQREYIIIISIPGNNMYTTPKMQSDFDHTHLYNNVHVFVQSLSNVKSIEGFDYDIIGWMVNNNNSSNNNNNNNNPTFYMLGLRCTHPPSHVSFFGSAINMDSGLFNYAIWDGGSVSYTPPPPLFPQFISYLTCNFVTIFDVAHWLAGLPCRKIGPRFVSRPGIVSTLHNNDEDGVTSTFLKPKNTQQLFVLLCYFGVCFK
jgi:hypothetical protein